MFFLVVVVVLSLFTQHSLQQAFPSDANNTIYWTTNYGAPVPDNDNLLSVGVRGSALLEDYLLLEKLANFDRERIPERVVHADGGAAKGVFTVTGDVSALTFANFLQPGTTTPLIARFSTVIPSRGGPETVRDPRGFAVKFYTQQGNYDLVGNNIPVFFIRDGMKFPDMVHSLKPNPVNNQQEWWRIWDFFSFHPESTHMFTFLLDDVGIPTDFRHMDGFGVHTYIWVSPTGGQKFVKYHWLTSQGVQSLVTDEEVQAITQDHHAQKDLFDSITNGQFPQWTLNVQVMDPATVGSLTFDPLDPTKTWPTDVYPLQQVGVMTLNQNVDHWFSENEQLAFSPSNIVPGIYYSADKLLQARLFSYPDTQRYRLGGNYLLLPVNIPRCPFHNNNLDGFMNYVRRSSTVNYFPSRVESGTQNAPAYNTGGNDTLGPVAPTRATILSDDFSQPGLRYESFNTSRRLRFQQRLIGYFSDPRIHPASYAAWLGYWNNTHPEIGNALLTKIPYVPSTSTSTSSTTASSATTSSATTTTTPTTTSSATISTDTASTTGSTTKDNVGGAINHHHPNTTTWMLLAVLTMCVVWISNNY